MIEINILCPLCGTSYSTSIDAEDKMSLCPSPNCYGKRSKCTKCDEVSTFTQPDEQTGNIIDVCDKHFTLRFGG